LAVNLALWLRDAFPSAVRSYQALTFYPALAYGVDNNGIGIANFIGVGNRRLSRIVYRIKVACGRCKQSRHSACGGRFSKIADPKFHARKIKRQRPIGNDKLSVENFKLTRRRRLTMAAGNGGNGSLEFQPIQQEQVAAHMRWSRCLLFVGKPVWAELHLL
jgi:hypothetical protein